MSEEITEMASVTGAPAPAARPRRLLRRMLFGAGAVFVVLVVTAAMLYFLGGMQPPSASARATYDSLVAAGQQPAVPARLTIPIPGCVCHSDDPVLQVQHSTRHMSECSGCHSRG